IRRTILGIICPPKSADNEDGMGPWQDWFRSASGVSLQLWGSLFRKPTQELAQLRIHESDKFGRAQGYGATEPILAGPCFPNFLWPRTRKDKKLNRFASSHYRHPS